MGQNTWRVPGGSIQHPACGNCLPQTWVLVARAVCDSECGSLIACQPALPASLLLCVGEGQIAPSVSVKYFILRPSSNQMLYLSRILKAKS